MKSIAGSQTEKNLLMSFAGESQALNRYTMYAKKAKKEGYERISAVFTEIADQERVHAKTFFRFLEGGELEITAVYPAGKIGSTAENLAAAAQGEKHEHELLYPEFAATARLEGFEAVALIFEYVAVAEAYHESRFRLMLERVAAGTVFSREEPVTWRCRKCGFVHEGLEAPKVCVACKHPKSYFEEALD